MKILIAYSSLTGNTERVAKRLYDSLSSKHDITICKAQRLVDSDPVDIDEFDVVLFGYWVDRGTAEKESAKIIKSIKNKPVAFFATLGATPDSEHGEKVRLKAPRLLDKSCECLGLGLYRGKVDDKLIEKLQNDPPLFLPKFVLKKMLDSSLTSRPATEEELDEACVFFDKLLDKFEASRA